MNEKLSEKELDRFAGALVREFSLDAAELESIADSADLRRGVRLAIADLNARKSRRGGLFGFGWMTPVFAALLLGVCFGAVVLTMMLRKGDTELAAVPAVSDVTAETPAVSAILPGTTRDESGETKSVDRAVIRPKSAATSVVSKSRTVAPTSTARPRVVRRSRESGADSKAERLTDFIALSYARNSEGGQVVRVKVPSSMMVTLGVVSEVRNNAELVSADVVVGDDGLARAIRFVK